MADKPILLWIGDIPAPPNVAAATDQWEMAPWNTSQGVPATATQPRLAVIRPNGQAGDPVALTSMLTAASTVGGFSIVLLPGREGQAWEVARRFGHCVPLPEDTPAAVLQAKFEALSEVQPAVRQLQSDLAQVAYGPTLDEIASLNEEMRLAAKLQQDFLPRELPTLGPVSFEVLYQPAGWVSGDIYDAARLDEVHVGFYVADAVGHGLPAALLTMFIKKALQTKRISGQSYEIIPPDEALSELNSAICEQELSSCHFCTAVYGVLNTATLELTYARAGHPEPVLLHRDGQIELLQASGSLLGVFPETVFESQKVQLHCGDRLIVYSDGVEDALHGRENADRRTFAETIAPHARLSGRDIVSALDADIRHLSGNTRPLDDITVLAVDIAVQ